MPKTRSEVGQWKKGEPVVARLGKAHVDFWKSRLRRRTYRGTDGLLHDVPEWQVKLFRDGKQRWVNLGTANKDDAAKEARDTWVKLQSLGWESVRPAKEKIANPNVGQFLEAVRAEADIAPATFEIYAKKFRRLVAGAFGIRDDKSKHDYAGGGYDRWLARVHAVRFSRLSARSIQRWKTRYIAAAAGNPLKERQARRTVASVLRSSKALFASKVVSKLHLELPSPIPLADVEVPRTSVAAYVSKVDPMLLFQQAQRELSEPTQEILERAVQEPTRPKRTRKTPRKRAWNAGPEALANRHARAIERERYHRQQAFRAFCLALFAGLRRDEIDTLTWKQIDFANSVIRIETNEFTRAKSEGSEAGVDIDPAFTELLRGWMKESKSAFVIEVEVEARPEVSTYHHYRCDCVFKRLIAWLHSRGVDGRNALHVLRKEFGTAINRTHGLFAASAALRHSSIQLTRAVYVAKKDRAVFAMPSDEAKESMVS